MSATHTPGPWKLKLGKGIEYTYLVSDRKGQDIANFAHYPNATKTQTKANARLIAAAPELLSWLKWSMKYLQDDVKQSGQYEMAQAVIAKATGATT